MIDCDDDHVDPIYALSSSLLPIYRRVVGVTGDGSGGSRVLYGDTEMFQIRGLEPVVVATDKPTLVDQGKSNATLNGHLIFTVNTSVQW